MCETFATTRSFRPDAPANSLGVVRVQRIRVNVDDAHWSAVDRLMAPADLSGDCIFSEGPPVRFTRASTYGIEAIELIVTDVADATKRFSDAGATARDGAVYIGDIRIELHA